MSRSVFVPGISHFLNELMSIRGMDLHQGSIKDISKLEGKTFLEAIRVMKEEYDAIPLGIVREGKLVINPSNEEVFRKEDEVLYISRRKVT